MSEASEVNGAVIGPEQDAENAPVQPEREPVQPESAEKPAQLEVNAIVEGEVVKIKPFGAIVHLPDRSQGLVHISHISNKFVQNIEDFVSVGDVVTVKVLSIDRASGKISLSMKEAEQRQAPPRPQSRYRDSGGDRGFGHRDSNYSNDPSSLTFEDKFKDWVRASNDRQAGLNKRNKRR